MGIREKEVFKIRSDWNSKNHQIKLVISQNL